jgi:hypothetical protein
LGCRRFACSRDVYVAYVDNVYYLFNHRYPDVGIAINISR